MSDTAVAALLDTDAVLREEAKAIHGTDLGNKKDAELYQALNGLKASALCLSGGGIRSASFALGVIQAIATHPRADNGDRVGTPAESTLAKFHYLSTVSGGGYIGGWLSAWLGREYLAGSATWEKVWKALTSRRDDPDEDAAQLRWLRSYSNFLTPKLGIASADSWAAVALCVRNLLLNWLVIIPVLCLVILFLKLVAMLVAWVSVFDPRSDSSSLLFYALVAVGAVLFFVALRFVTRQRPTRGPSDADQTCFLKFDLAPAALATVLFVIAIAGPQAEILANDWLAPDGELAFGGVAALAGLAALLYVAAWIAARPRLRNRTDWILDLAMWAIAGAIYGALLAVGIYLYFFVVPSQGFWPFQPKEMLLLTAGVPFAITAQLIAEMIFVGLTSFENGSDTDREWLGRAAGWFLVTALGWFVVMFLVIVGSKIATDMASQIWTWVTTLVSGGVTGLLGNSKHRAGKGEAKTKTQISLDLVLAIAAPVFAMALVIAASALLDHAIFGEALIDTSGFHRPVDLSGQPVWPASEAFWIAVGLTFFIGAIASWAVNINRFSLHGLYRNRLIRAFLGASNPPAVRKPNPFTDFDENDNMRVYDLWPKEVMPGQWPQRTEAAWRPFHIVNTALNIVSTKNLAWQERKAEPFSVSPLHSGSSCVGYRYSTSYGDKQGITLGTAVAISGAAASPNMGYHSSAPLAFLMTLFNVRLGWWLGNPGSHGEKTYMRDSPQFAVVPLLAEMFGQTTDENKYVYLSDGGHFENLGLYEMVRRRCRYIVVSDAGCDPAFGFEDLGNAVRKIEIDLGVPIDIKKLEVLAARSKDGKAQPNVVYHAVGMINYAVADGAGEPGYLIYIKPSYHGVEGAGIRAYACANTDFPHEGTGDQFFSESQFESYRSLGFEITDGLLTAAKKANPQWDGSLKSLFETVAKL
jgi:hypothetical protein